MSQCADITRGWMADACMRVSAHIHTRYVLCDGEFSRTDRTTVAARAAMGLAAWPMEVCPAASGQNAAHQPHVCGVSGSDFFKLF